MQRGFFAPLKVSEVNLVWNSCRSQQWQFNIMDKHQIIVHTTLRLTLPSRNTPLQILLWLMEPRTNCQMIQRNAVTALLVCTRTLAQTQQQERLFPAGLAAYQTTAELCACKLLVLIMMFNVSRWRRRGGSFCAVKNPNIRPLNLLYPEQNNVTDDLPHLKVITATTPEMWLLYLYRWSHGATRAHFQERPVLD